MSRDDEFYETVIEVHVLSEDGPYDCDSLEELHTDIHSGPCVGKFSVTQSKPLTGKQMAKRLSDLGSQPEFFQLDDDGKPLDE